MRNKNNTSPVCQEKSSLPLRARLATDARALIDELNRESFEGSTVGELIDSMASAWRAAEPPAMNIHEDGDYSRERAEHESSVAKDDAEDFEYFIDGNPQAKVERRNGWWTITCDDISFSGKNAGVMASYYAMTMQQVVRLRRAGADVANLRLALKGMVDVFSPRNEPGPDAHIETVVYANACDVITATDPAPTFDADGNQTNDSGKYASRVTRGDITANIAELVYHRDTPEFAELHDKVRLLLVAFVSQARANAEELKSLRAALSAVTQKGGVA